MYLNIRDFPMQFSRQVKIYFLFMAVLSALTFPSSAQVTISPYSRYGIGELNKGTFSHNLSLGNTAIGLRNPLFINIANPASYSSFDVTAFEAGLNSNFTNLSLDTASFNSYHASFAYLGFGLPIMPWWGMSFGLLPFSSTGYNVLYNHPVENIGNVSERYQGSGGINKAYFGNGFKYGKFSAGFNASYLFGALIKERRLVYPANISFNSIAISETSVSDFNFDFGIQFRDSISKKWILNLGAVYGLGTELNANRQQFFATYQSFSGVEQIVDTSLFETARGTIVLPETYGAGFSLESEKWVIAGDWKYGKWSDFRNFGRSDSLVNSMEYTLAGQYTPDREAVASYWKIIQYRAGIRYNATFLQLNNEQLIEYGITFGTGLPLRRAKTIINAGFEIGQKGTTKGGLIRERFIIFNLGIAINDKWFIKRKYD